MERPRFKPRAVMDIAIKVMQQSLAESRHDGKASPRVGAVLLKPGAAPHDTAYRGEIRDGDHAEFTLLERKNRDKPLDGSVLFTTLEPCAPGARNHPKLSCAERIVLARIKEVWVGIADPDPKVDRKGIKYLQDHGVTVHMFDQELQEVIREANKEFIAQALERAEAAEEQRRPKEVQLSPLEDAFQNSALDDFSREALQQYCKSAEINDTIDSVPFRRRLVQQGLLKQEGDVLTPTGFGLLLFGNEPRTAMPQAGLLGTIQYEDGREEVRDFDGPQVLAPVQALQWLRDKLPNPIARSESRRREANEVFFELAREGIVNAIVHRDYAIEGAKCQMIVTADTVTISSPGKPPDPITVEQMQSFKTPMLSRNPILHYVFAQMELAEERGLGLKSMKVRSQQAGLPLPRYAWKPPYLALTIFRSAESAARALKPEVLASLNDDEQAGWQFLATQHGVSKADYAEAMGFDDRKAQRHLKRFVELGLVRRLGSGKATSYEVLSETYD
jgi:ATP-dependent DNA helicase RecG